MADSWKDALEKAKQVTVDTVRAPYDWAKGKVDEYKKEVAEQEQREKERAKLNEDPLTKHHKGTTELPDAPAFSNPERTNNILQSQDDISDERFGYYKKEGDMTGDKGMRIEQSTPDPAGNKPGFQYRPFQLNRNLVPYYQTSKDIWNNIANMKISDVINTQTGDPNYYEEMLNHYKSISPQDYTRAGLYRYPEEEMRAFGDSPAPVPDVTEWGGDKQNAFYNPGNGKISIFKPGEKTGNQNNLSNRAGWPTNHLEGDLFYKMPVGVDSPEMLGAMYQHELNHKMSSPTIGWFPYRLRQYNKLNPSVPGPFTVFNRSGGLVSPIYFGLPIKSFQSHFGIGTEPTVPLLRTPDGVVDEAIESGDFSGLEKYPGLDIKSIPANPTLRRKPVRQHFDFIHSTMEGGSTTDTDNDYAYNHDEITQAMMSLNRGQRLLQQEIRKNPQKYIDAGIDPAVLGQYLQMPTFLKSPEQLDRRMEFYINNPIFMHMLGTEPARIIPRYIMLERERRNPKQTPEWRNYHQDMFNFMRANYMLAKNGRPQRPLETGMGRMYSNLA